MNRAQRSDTQSRNVCTRDHLTRGCPVCVHIREEDHGDAVLAELSRELTVEFETLFALMMAPSREEFTDPKWFPTQRAERAPAKAWVSPSWNAPSRELRA